MDSEMYCCRCGTKEAEVYWGPAYSYDLAFWLCTECQDAIMYRWIQEQLQELAAAP